MLAAVKLGKEEEMNSENACLTSTGNYTTSGMPQQRRMLEAIEKSLAYFAIVVRKDIFTLARPIMCSSRLCFHTCVVIRLNSSLIRCCVALWIWLCISTHRPCTLMTNRQITCKCDCLPFFKSAEATATLWLLSRLDCVGNTEEATSVKRRGGWEEV